MAGNDENRKNCDNGCGCSAGAWGAALAKATIEAEGFSADVPGNDDVQAFIDECKRHGKYPVAVARDAADSEGINVAKDAPKDVNKRAVYNLFWKVVQVCGDPAMKEAFVRIRQTKGGDGFTNETLTPRQCVVTPVIVGYAFSW